MDGATVTDLLTGTSATTTPTGTVSLAFLTDSGSIVRIKKIGYVPMTITAPASEADTLPITVLMEPSAQMLPAAISRDSATRHRSPGLQAFEERRRAGVGQFIDDRELRRRDNAVMSELVTRFTGLALHCGTTCVAYSTRQGSARQLIDRDGCAVKVYVDGNAASLTADLSRMRASDYSGVEFYAGPSTVPVQYNVTGSVCGVLFLWTRER